MCRIGCGLISAFSGSLLCEDTAVEKLEPADFVVDDETLECTTFQFGQRHAKTRISKVRLKKQRSVSCFQDLL